MKEEEIQEAKNQGLISDKKDLTLFERLYAILKKPSKEMQPPSGFTLKMRQEFERQQRIKQRELLWRGVGIVVLILAAIISLLIIGGAETFEYLVQYYEYVLIFGVVVFVFQIIEKKLMKSS